MIPCLVTDEETEAQKSQKTKQLLFQNRTQSIKTRLVNPTVAFFASIGEQ